MLQIDGEALRDDILEELDTDPKVDSSRIGVMVDDNVVTLTGTVPNLTQKWAAEEAAKRVKGVVAVAQQIEVELPAMHKRNDRDIAHAFAEALYWDTSVPASVQATVQDGFVTLTGECDWNYQRDDAEAEARRIAGVRGITNLISLRESVPAKDIRGGIQRLFHRDAQIDANTIQIETDGGKVILKGSVHSLFERSEASRAAWSVKGVTEVENRLTIN
jgi:osmotically-inducible protein OsmY